MKQETACGSGISWAICKSAPRSRQITTPAPHHSHVFSTGRMPFLPPNQQRHCRCTEHACNSTVTATLAVVAPDLAVHVGDAHVELEVLEQQSLGGRSQRRISMTTKLARHLGQVHQDVLLQPATHARTHTHTHARTHTHTHTHSILELFTSKPTSFCNPSVVESIVATGRKNLFLQKFLPKHSPHYNRESYSVFIKCSQNDSFVEY